MILKANGVQKYRTGWSGTEIKKPSCWYMRACIAVMIDYDTLFLLVFASMLNVA